MVGLSFVSRIPYAVCSIIHVSCLRERSAPVGAPPLTTMPGTDSLAVHVAVPHRKFPKRGPVLHDSDVRKPAEEIVRALACVQRRWRRALAPTPGQTDQSTRARRCPDGKQNLVRAHRHGNAVRIRARLARANANLTV